MTERPSGQGREGSAGKDAQGARPCDWGGGSHARDQYYGAAGTDSYGSAPPTGAYPAGGRAAGGSGVGSAGSYRAGAQGAYGASSADAFAAGAADAYGPGMAEAGTARLGAELPTTGVRHQTAGSKGD